MKTHQQIRNNKRTEIERIDWFIERTQTRVAFGWLSERSGEKTSCPRTLQKSIDTLLWRHIATRLANQTMIFHVRIFFGGKTKSPSCDLLIHWLIKQITNTYLNYFSRSYENHSKWRFEQKSLATDTLKNSKCKNSFWKKNCVKSICGVFYFEHK